MDNDFLNILEKEKAKWEGIVNRDYYDWAIASKVSAKGAVMGINDAIFLFKEWMNESHND